MTSLAIEVKDLEFAWPSMAAFLSVPTLSLQQVAAEKPLF
jgi:hypothetical protein